MTCKDVGFYIKILLSQKMQMAAKNFKYREGKQGSKGIRQFPINLCTIRINGWMVWKLNLMNGPIKITEHLKVAKPSDKKTLL